MVVMIWSETFPDYKERLYWMSKGIHLSIYLAAMLKLEPME